MRWKHSQSSHAELRHLDDLAPAQPHGRPRATLNRTSTCVVAMPLGWRVVAGEEVEEMPTPAQSGLVALAEVGNHLVHGLGEAGQSAVSHLVHPQTTLRIRWCPRSTEAPRRVRRLRLLRLQPR
jgi:hypothetical protein